ncbi:carbohydrate ABC transporter permease [Gracilibacillus saliphilus]|uniref:carbohydrate ABC transporter permease n=1 Tax=Gracilibacillus saliphilus TaxID=543890 RepID=UPI0013D26935|nr:carbohydrate ABC transporter permease [Gracilibacillus saliphilus]
MIYKTKGYRIFTAFNYVFLAFLAFICVLPLIHILAVSLSGSAAASGNMVSLWPVDFTWDAYDKTMGNDNFIRSLLIAIQRTVLGTIISMGLLLCAAYGLSKYDEEFKGRKWYMWFFVFTMLFNGGIVPTYIIVTGLGLGDTIWSLVLPTAINAFNLILLLNFFRTSVPKSLEESAFIDGAGHFTIFLKIYLPISIPAIATVSLFTMVFHWNQWFDGLIYMTNERNYPLQTFLQSIVVKKDLSNVTDAQELKNMSQRTVESAQIFISALPMLIVYPFIQKYFVKGIVLGAEKE